MSRLFPALIILALMLTACGGGAAPTAIVVIATNTPTPSTGDSGQAATATVGQVAQVPTTAPTVAPPPVAPPTTAPTLPPTEAPPTAAPTTPPPPTNTPVPTATPMPDLGSTDIVKQYGPGTVFVSSEVGGQFGNLFYNGTGFLIDKANGIIVTNAHVVEGAAKVEVFFPGMRPDQGLIPKVLGRSNCDDIAVLQVNARQEPAMKLGNSDQLEQGGEVFALGYSAGTDAGETPKVTSGEANDLHQNVEFLYGIWSDAIITDANINPGNSGGPLFNNRGEVIGINSGKYDVTQSENTNFAISINAAKPIIDQLRQGRDQDWLGMLLYPNSPEIAAQYGLPVATGAIVTSVSSGAPADKAGVRAGDILLKMENADVETTGDVCKTTKNRRNGDEVRVDVNRGGALLSGKVIIGQRGGRDRQLAQVGPPPPPTPSEDEPTATPDDGGDDGGFEIVVQEDFEDGDAGEFGTGSGTGYEVSVEDGEYVLSVETKGQNVYSFPSEYEDLTDAVVAANVTPDGDGYAAVAVRIVEDDDDVEMVMCWISNERKTGCYKRLNGKWSIVAKEKSLSAIKPNEKNQIILAAIGSQYAFEVNDVDAFSFTDSSLDEGGFGVYAEALEDNFEARYDDIAIVRPKS